MVDVRLGLIGCGEHVRRRLPYLEGIVAVADPSEARREATPLDVRRFASHRELLDACRLDGVVVASPHALHFAHVADALAAGCHVLVYKPMVTTSADALEVARLARASGRIVS